jgi:hypothetical protein
MPPPKRLIILHVLRHILKGRIALPLVRKVAMERIKYGTNIVVVYAILSSPILLARFRGFRHLRPFLFSVCFYSSPITIFGGSGDNLQSPFSSIRHAALK